MVPYAIQKVLVVYFVQSTVLLLIPSSQFISQPLQFSTTIPSGNYKFVFYIGLYFCFVNKFVYIVFKDSICK